MNKSNRLIHSAISPFNALKFIIWHPSIWHLCILPLLINAIVVYFTWKYSLHHLNAFEQSWESAKAFSVPVLGSCLSFIMVIFNYIVTILIAVIASIIVGNVASIPFNDILSEKVEIILKSLPERPLPTLSQWLHSVVTLILQELIRIFLLLATAILLLILSFIPGLALATFPLSLVFTFYFLAFDYLAYPLERRGYLLLKDKFNWINNHFSPSMAFGAGANIFVCIPVIRYVFIPLLVVGGTLFFIEEEGKDRNAGL